MQGTKILMEKRPPKEDFANQLLLPGGIVEEHEVENLEAALKREAMEELGVNLIDFISIDGEEAIYGARGKLLRHFLITAWEGQIPKAVLDNGNPLTWLELEEMFNLPVEPVRKTANLLKKFLSRKYDSSQT